MSPRTLPARAREAIDAMMTPPARPASFSFGVLRHCAGPIGVVALLLLSACGSPPVAEAPPAGAPAPAMAASAPEPAEAASAAPARPSLMAERSRLAALFRGTPVDFSMQPDGSMRVNIPLRYCFDTGRAVIKAPLAAVLDRLATSQAGGSSRIVITTPGDAPAGSAKAASAKAGSAPAPSAAASAAAMKRERLASQRVARLTDYLSAKGIAADRLTAAPPASATSVRLVVSDRPQP